MNEEDQLTPTQFIHSSFYDRNEAQKFQNEMKEKGYELYDFNSNRTNSYFSSFAYKRPYPQDINGFTDDTGFKKDEIEVLKYCQKLSDTGTSVDCEVYENCVYYLYKRGWITGDLHITPIGRIALENQMILESQK
jgi:hypothetical protein